MKLLAIHCLQAALCQSFGLAAVINGGDTSCKKLTVKENDTCLNITRRSDATFAQIIQWNSDIKQDCSNLADLQGKEICVSNPDGDFSLPSNSHGVTSTASTVAPVPTKIPKDTNKRCGEWYRVKEGDDCSDLLLESGITREDFLFLNPQVSQNCTDLWLDYAYCIEPVGAISTYPGYGGATTRPPFHDTPSTPLPKNSTFPVPPSPTPIPLAKDTRRDCYAYHVRKGGPYDVTDCWSVARFYAAESEDFILWNPSLAESNDTLKALCGSCAGTNGDASDPGALGRRDETTTVASNTTTMSYAYPCTISSSLSYCVQLSRPTKSPENPMPKPPPGPRADGEIKNCTDWQAPDKFLDCKTLVINHHITFDEFYKMNPSVGSDCTKMSLGTYYCVSTFPEGSPAGIDGYVTTTSASPPATSTTLAPGTTPSPIQDGMTKSCDKFFKVNKGDVCGDIAQKYKISDEDFLKWNPAVKKDCTGLVADNYVCVGVK